jgi:signal transduction histidine kinase
VPVRPPRVGTILLAGSLAALSLPVAGLFALHLYESALVRQTESELLAQAAFTAAAARIALGAPSEAGPVGATALAIGHREGLDFARDPILPPPPAPGPAGPAEPRAAAAGRTVEALLREAQPVTLAALRLTDAGGTIVATTGSDAGQSLAAWDEVRQVQAGAPFATGMHRREQPARDSPAGIGRAAGLRVFAAMPVLDGERLVAIVVASRTPATLGQVAWGKRWTLLATGVALLGAVVLLSLAGSRLIARPLANVAGQARLVASGQARAIAPLTRPGTREVAELSTAIVRLAAQIERRSDYIRGFAASVSHEFKTPLAATRAAAELLADPATTSAERDRLLTLITDGTDRLERLVRRMLELARADMMRPSPPTSIRPVLEELCPQDHLEITGDPLAPLPRPALLGLFGALIQNAQIHGDGNLRVTAEAASGWTVVTIADGGKGISAENRKRIFEPFFTTARSNGSTGLGLPIAQALAGAVGGTVEFDDGAIGTVFRVRLPLTG